MAQQARDEAGNIWNVDDQGNVISLAQPAPAQGGGGGQFIAKPVDPSAQYDGPKAAADLERTQQAIGIDAATAARDKQKLDATLYLRGLRIGANGQPEPIPNWKDPKKVSTAGNGGMLDAVVAQVNETRRLFNQGVGQTSGLEGLRDYIPYAGNNGEFDAAADQLEDIAAGAFRVPGSGTQTDADAARIARANKPSRWKPDGTTQQTFKGLQARIDALRVAQGLPPAKWDFDENDAPVQRQDDAAIPTVASGGGGSGGNPPTPPGYNGPAGYDVAGVAGGVSGGPGGAGSTFANAAGVAMAEKLKDAYNQGAGVSQLNELLRTNGFQEFTDPQSIEQIQKRGALNFAPSPMDDTRGAVGRAMGSVADSAPGAYAISAADAVTAGNLDTLAGGPAGLAQDYARQQYPGASLLGSVTGGALAAGGAELGLARAGLTAGRAALGGDALYGAAYGAGSSDGGNRLLGAAVGGTAGLAGGVAGRAAARGIGRALTGVRNADVQALRQAGVPLTAGQVAGGPIKRVEDAMTSIPFVGDVVNARRLEGFRGFNRAAFDEGLAPVSGPRPANAQPGWSTGGQIAEQGVDAAQGTVRQGYRNALDGVSVTRDPQFTGDYNSAITTGAGVPRVGPEFEAWARADLDPLVAQPSFDGRTVQDFIQQTRKADFGSDAMGNLVGRSVKGAEDAMRGLVGRQSPDTLPALRQADQAFRQTEVLRDAVNRARNGTRVGEPGTFAPSQLADAAAANARKYGNSQGTTRQPFFDLSRAGQSVLPSSIGDSGTFTRQAIIGGASLGAGGAGGYALGGSEGAGTGAGTGLALGALLAAGGTRGGQRALTSLLADRPNALIQLGDKIQRRSRYGGIFGAPLLAGGATALLPQ